MGIPLVPNYQGKDGDPQTPAQHQRQAVRGQNLVLMNKIITGMMMAIFTCSCFLVSVVSMVRVMPPLSVFAAVTCIVF